MKFYITSQCSPEKNIGRAVAELASLGYTDIELTGGTLWYPGLMEDLAEKKQRLELNFMVHNYFPPQENDFVMNLAVKDPARRSMMKNHVHDALRLSKTFGQNIFGLHPGFRQDVSVEQINGFFKAGDPEATSEEAFYAMLDDLDAMARSENMLIAIEHLAPRTKDDHFSFITDASDIERYLGNLSKWSNLGFLLDLGHMGAASAMLGFDRERMLDIVFEHADKIYEVHISENRGSKDAHGVTPFDSWQIAYLKNKMTMLGEIPVVFEWANAATASSFEIFQTLRNVLGR